MKGIHLIILGAVLATTGALLPLLIVIKMLPSTFFLAFFSHGASISGLFLGVIGVSMLVDTRK